MQMQLTVLRPQQTDHRTTTRLEVLIHPSRYCLTLWIVLLLLLAPVAQLPAYAHRAAMGWAHGLLYCPVLQQQQVIPAYCCWCLLLQNRRG
jgi:hypothetical protein